MELVVYSYNPQTFKYIGKETCLADPVTGHPMIPANCLFNPPPEVTLEKGQGIMYNKNTNNWYVGTDFLGVDVIHFDEDSTEGRIKPAETSFLPDNEFELTEERKIILDNQGKAKRDLANPSVLIMEKHIKTDEEIESEKKQERNQKLNNIEWRVQRYQTQAAAGVETTDSEETYKLICQYMQYLRDLPDNKKWPNVVVLDFEDWCEK